MENFAKNPNASRSVSLRTLIVRAPIRISTSFSSSSTLEVADGASPFGLVRVLGTADTSS